MAVLGSRRTVMAALLFALSLVLVACSAGIRTQLRRADYLEQEHHYDTALAIYDAALPLVPHKDGALMSRVQFRRGECLWALGRATEAFAAYNRSLEADPSNQDARLKIAGVYLAAGAPDKALEQADVYLHSHAENAEVLGIVGGAFAAMGKISDAVQTLNRALSMDATNEHIAIALADLFNEIDREEEARDVLKKSVAAVPSHVEAWLALGRLEEQQGNNQAAEAAYRSAVKAQNAPRTNLRLAQFLERNGRAGEAELILRNVDAMRPSMPTALADFQLISGRANKAEQGYEGALRQAKPPAAATGTVAANDRGALIARLIEAEITDAADHAPAKGHNPALDRARRHLVDYREQLDPAAIGVLEAEMSLAENDLPMAVLHAQSALAVSATSAPAHYVLGEAHLRAGERALAREQWLAALDGDDGYAPARLALASFSLSASAPDDAVEYLTPVVRQEPGNLRALVLYSRALAMQRRYDAADTIARRAAAVDPSSPTPHMLLGDIALAQRQLSRALMEFEQAVLLQPHAADAIEGLTRVYRYGKLNRTLMEHMEIVADTPPRSATLMEIAGRLFADRGFTADAERCFRRSLEVDPTRTTAAAALARTLAAHGDAAEAARAASQTGAQPAALVAAIEAHDRGDYHTAIREYEFAVRHGDRSGVAANNLAWIYAHEGTRLDRALSLAHSAHDLQPDSPAVMDTIGIVHFARREYSQSVEALEKAERLLKQLPANDPQRAALGAAIEQHLAEAYLRAGRSDDAAKLVNR